MAPNPEMQPSDKSRPQPAATPPAPTDGRAVRRAFEGALAALEANKETVNALNVFPVPDGDTGTNMALTLRSTLDDTAAAATGHAGRDMSAMARAALLGARGNSGLILAQFFKGMSVALGGSPTMGASEFARGMRLATEGSYKSMPDPKEGTLLTVFRECAAAAETAAATQSTLANVWEAALLQARETVAMTPSMLEVLREAGVVDSGGYGFMVMLEGGLAVLKGGGGGGRPVPVPEARVGGKLLSGRVSARFAASAREEVWGYCTSFAIVGDGLMASEVTARMGELGKSTVVAGDSSLLKVHVHALDPGQPLSYGASLGTLSNIEIKNMDEQARHQAASWSGAAAPALAGPLKIAVVAVVAGEGMRGVFESAGLGACTVLTGGDTMNPSTAEILKAVDGAGAGSVIVLPNNKNVLGTAGQAAALSAKKIAVVPTRSQQAGIGALLAFQPDSDLESNVKAMTEGAAQVRAGSVNKATRTTSVNGHKIVAGRFIGVLDDKVVAVADTPETALVEMLRGRYGDAGLVTLYTGAAVREAAASKVAGTLREAMSGVEIQVVIGGQPHHEYLVALE